MKGQVRCRARAPGDVLSGNDRVTKAFLNFFDGAVARMHRVRMAKANNTNSTKKVRTTVAAKVSHASSLAASRPGAAEVALRAYEIYEREGRPDGHDLEHWNRAEAELGLSP
jgi:Protein of unknown function (DUF2934)